MCLSFVLDMGGTCKNDYAKAEQFCVRIGSSAALLHPIRSPAAIETRPANQKAFFHSAHLNGRVRPEQSVKHHQNYQDDRQKTARSGQCSDLLGALLANLHDLFVVVD